MQGAFLGWRTVNVVTSGLGCPYAPGSWILPDGTRIDGFFLIDTGANVAWIDAEMAERARLPHLGLADAIAYGADASLLHSVGIALHCVDGSMWAINHVAQRYERFSALLSPTLRQGAVIGAVGMEVLVHLRLTVERGACSLLAPPTTPVAAG